MCRCRRSGPAMDVSEICTGAVMPVLDGLASLGKDKQVMCEEGEKPKDRCFSLHIITDLDIQCVQRENITVKMVIHMILLVLRPSNSHYFRVTVQFVLSLRGCWNTRQKNQFLPKNYSNLPSKAEQLLSPSPLPQIAYCPACLLVE